MPSRRWESAMALVADPSAVFNYALSGDAFIDSLLQASNSFRYGWSTQLNGATNITYSFPYAANGTALFHSNYGPEPAATTVGGADATVRAATALAMSQWANVANITFTEVAETAGGQVGDIRIAFSSQVSGGFWGYAKLVSSGAFNMHGDIWIAPDVAADPWAPGNFNFTALMHEIGHSLGLAHPFEGNIIPAGYDNGRYTIMSYDDPENVYFFNPNTLEFEYLLLSPMVYDIAAIQHIYGPNMNHNNGATSYVFARDEPFFLTIWDAGGTDTIDITDFTNSCIIRMEDGSYSTLGFSNHPVTDNLGIAFNCFIENVLGGTAGDTITGNELVNRLEGRGGHDVLNGIGGNDLLFGGGGNDTLNGGGGDDRMLGGAGNDRFFVNSLADRVFETVTGSPADTNDAGGTDTVNSSITLSLNAYNGVKFVENLVLTGTSVINGTGNDLANVITGNEAVNRLAGGNGNDRLLGKGGDDILLGENNDDWLQGGVGRDIMTGGANADKFVFDDGEFGGATGATADRIIDFIRAEGDKIRLTDVDANTTNGTTDDPFVFIGNAAFSNVAGQLRYQQIAGNTFVMGDTNGVGGADFWIRVDGLVSFLATDFQL
jgi:Ca2+-binding RTX toxin-like protein